MLYLLLLITHDPYQPVQTHCVEVLELNVMHSRETGEPCLKQWICWNTNQTTGDIRVCEWWLFKGERAVKQRDGTWIVVVWVGHRMELVRAVSFKRSHTLHDPELVDREVVAKDQRERLWR